MDEERTARSGAGGGASVLPEALALDFDGTIVDTETPWYRAWQAVYAGFGAALPAEEWARTVGTAGDAFDPVAYLEARVGRPLDRAALQGDFRARGLALQARQKLRPGVRALLEEARGLDLPVALASSSPRPWIQGYLERFDLLRFFRTICTAEDVRQVKPAPDLYRLAVRRLGVAASRTVALEDSPHGAAAALAAGVPCVVVPNAFTRVLRFPEGATVLPTLRGRGLEALAQAAFGRGPSRR